MVPIQNTNPRILNTKFPRGFRILVLHSNRQVPATFQKRTREVFARAVGPGSTLIYASAPHKYIAKGEALNNTKHLQASNNEGTRCWWNASDDAATMIYSGMDETIQYINEIAKRNGPFDGIIGFSQGGTLAGILAALVSDKSQSVEYLANLQFVIIVSGFYVRDTRKSYCSLNGPLRDKANPIQIPSFHVWGLNDMLVLPDRSKALRDSFAEEVDGIHRMTVPHNLDHYKNAIKVWPVDQICEWVCANFKPAPLNPCISLQEKLYALCDNRYINDETFDDKLVGKYFEIFFF